MVKLIWLLLAGLLLGVAAWWGLGSDSYVLIRLGDWALQLSIWSALLIGLLAWLVIALLRFALTGFGLFDWLRHLRRGRRSKQLRANFLAYFSGDWKAAGKGFLKHAERSADPLPALLLAAVATARAGDLQRALEILDDLLVAYPEAGRAGALIRAQIYADYQQVEAGLAQVEQLRKSGGSKAEASLMEARLAHLGGDMGRLKQSLKALASQKLVRAELVHVQRYYYLFELSREDIPAAELKELLATVPPASLTDPALVGLLVSRLGQIPGDDAVEILIKLIEKTWHPLLIEAFGDIESSQPRKQFKRAERWHAGHLSVELLETLQKLAWRANDADSAHDYAQQMRVLRSSRGD